MNDNWNNFAFIGPQVSDNIPYIDNLYNIRGENKEDNKEDNKEVLKLLEIKGSILSILQEKEDIILTDDEQKEIHKDIEKDNLNDFYEKVKQITDEFKECQMKLNTIGTSFKDEYQTIQKNAEMIEGMIDFIKKLPDDYKEDSTITKIINHMNKLCQNITNNNKMKQIRKEYVQTRKESEKMIQLIKKFNNFNKTIVCPLCFTNQVDHFIDPCGHTFCKECLLSTFKKPGIEGLELYEIGRSSDAQCCFCRAGIITVRPLFFL